jgi:hypothetical protein
MATITFDEPGLANINAQSTALEFPSNDEAGSDIRIIWDDTVLLPRHSHTAIWKAKYTQQVGYYAWAWHSANTGSWVPNYGYGTHPYPTDNESSPTYNSSDGQYTGLLYSGGGIDGDIHHHELADGRDIIACGSSITECGGAITPLSVSDGTWLTQARVAYEDGSDTVHIYWPDLVGNPSKKLVAIKTTSTITGSAGSTPAFYFGASDWTASGGANDETPSGQFRFFKLFDTDLSLSDIQTEAAYEGNTAQTAAGLANTWYMNINPTVSDVTDKSGEGNDPSWANANRPSDVSF